MCSDCLCKFQRSISHNKHIRLAPVLKTNLHQCDISYTCGQSNSDGYRATRVKTGYKYMICHIDEKLF